MELTRAQLSDFYERGYVVIEDFLAPEQLDAVKASILSIVNGEAGSESVELGFEDNDDRRNERKLQQILNVERGSGPVKELLESDSTLTLARQILGPDIGLHHAKVTLKSPDFGQNIPWHQDLVYWQHLSVHPVQLNCLICLDDTDEENGCLRVVPGSHRTWLWRHERDRHKSTFVWRIASEALGGCAVEALEARAGTAILFGPLLVHSSGENRTSRDRRVLALEYTIPQMDEWCRRVLRTRDPVPDPALFYPRESVAEVVGQGPYAGQCPEDYRRRELWKLAADLSSSERLWLDVSGGDSDTTAFDWLAGRRPRKLVRLERFPRAQVPPARATVLTGALEQSVECPELMRRLETANGVGLIHFDSDLYVCVAPVLEGLRQHIGEGTLFIFDRFTSPEGELTQAAQAFHETASEERLEVSYLARTSRQVVVQVTGKGGRTSFRAVVPDWRPSSRDLHLETSPPASKEGAGDGSPTERPSTPHRAWQRGTGILRSAAERLSRSSREMKRAFPVHSIPCFHGGGPRIRYCATHCRRKELWRYALSLVVDESLPWCEFGVGEGESLDWLSLRKPEANRLYGFDSFEGIPEPWAALPVGYFRSEPYRSERDDVEIVQGLFDDSLSREDVRKRLEPQIGLLHIDCDLYSSTRAVLESLRKLIARDTIIVFDEFYNYPGWQEHEAKAFVEFAREHEVSFEYVGRADYQVVVRVESVGKSFSHSVRPLAWRSETPGIEVSLLPG